MSPFLLQVRTALKPRVLQTAQRGFRGSNIPSPASLRAKSARPQDPRVSRTVLTQHSQAPFLPLPGQQFLTTYIHVAGIDVAIPGVRGLQHHTAVII